MVLILDSILSQTNLLSLVVLIIGLVILWIIVSIPAYLAGKVVTSGRSTFGEAMIATLFGPIVYAITLFVVDFFLGAIIGGIAYVFALILAFIAWVWVFKASFRDRLARWPRDSGALCNRVLDIEHNSRLPVWFNYTCTLLP